MGVLKKIVYMWSLEMTAPDSTG